MAKFSPSGGHDVKLSKTVSWILRHGAPSLNLTLDDGGYANVTELMRLKQMRGYRVTDLQRMVRDNDKQRFTIREDADSSLWIRANQGHSLEIPDLELIPVTSAAQIPVAIHGTTNQAWESIRRQGLSRMSRTHVHFACGEPGAAGVISGMRKSSQILIYLDLEQAIMDGLKFFLSANGVVLCPGNEQGLIAPKYFHSVFRCIGGSKQAISPDFWVTNEG